MNLESLWSSAWLDTYPWAQTLLALGMLVVGAWLANWVTKRILLRGLYRVLRATPIGLERGPGSGGVIRRLSNAVPALLLSNGIALVPGLPEAAITVVQNVAGAFVVLTIALAITELLNLISYWYELRPDAREKPIKGYVQVIKIAIYALAAILMVATLIDRSPLILLSGLGAMAAVLLLIFQDTLLSLVASVQISSNDMIRVGDWIEMPQLNADGDVVDIALHTVKVQNWDKTITTIPTKRLITESFKNWRGMSESGGRRIKRSLYIDQHSVRFLHAHEVARLGRITVLDSYLKEKMVDIETWNRTLAERGEEPLNTRRLTNLGTFRAYVRRYLRVHPCIHQDMTLMVRQLAPSAQGLALEIYCFTNTTAWIDYEAIQADIFDHLLAIVDDFGLRVFQQPSGDDLRALGGVPVRPDTTTHSADL